MKLVGQRGVGLTTAGEASDTDHSIQPGQGLFPRLSAGRTLTPPRRMRYG
jgi:hypothetical protein